VSGGWGKNATGELHAEGAVAGVGAGGVPGVAVAFPAAPGMAVGVGHGVSVGGVWGVCVGGAVTFGDGSGVGVNTPSASPWLGTPRPLFSSVSLYVDFTYSCC
jgi:hypothetical protein